jgi:hypothetical protein
MLYVLDLCMNFLLQINNPLRSKAVQAAVDRRQLHCTVSNTLPFSIEDSTYVGRVTDYVRASHNLFHYSWG